MLEPCIGSMVRHVPNAYSYMFRIHTMRTLIVVTGTTSPDFKGKYRIQWKEIEAARWHRLCSLSKNEIQIDQRYQVRVAGLMPVGGSFFVHRAGKGFSSTEAADQHS